MLLAMTDLQRAKPMTSSTVESRKDAQVTTMKAPLSQTATSNRLMSLDALRGFDMLWIIGGGSLVTALAKVNPTPFSQAVEAQFEHVPWAGLHLFDCIWPLFMFMVG